jgi:adhesin transport system outer membrane protein
LTKVLTVLVVASSILFAELIRFSEYENSSCSTQFETLISDAIRTHPSIAMAQDVVKGSKYQQDSAKWEYYPTPSVDVSYKNQDKKNIVARIDQPIWTGGKIDSKFDIATFEKEEAVYSLEESKYKIIDDGIKILQEYLTTKQKITLLNQNKAQFGELSLMLDRFMKAGELSQTDKNLLNSRIASLSSDLIVTKSKHKIAKVQFEILTGKSQQCEISYEHKKILPNHLDMQKLIEDLKGYHPALKIMLMKLKIAHEEVNLEKANLWPTVSIRGEHRKGTIYDETEPETENIAYIALSMSTGAGLSGISNIEKAKINISKVKNEKYTKEKELIDQLMADYTAYVTTIGHLNILEQDIQTAKKLYASNKRLFVSQQKKWLDVVNSLSELNRLIIKHSEVNIEKQILEYKIALKTGRVDLNTLEVVSGL